MDILSIPFHRLLNIERIQNDDDFIFQIEERPELHNHLGTFHACAQLTLAEATSGEYLLQQFREIKDVVVPVIRRTEVKYSMPANGILFSKASFSSTSKQDFLKELETKNRCIISIKVEVFNTESKRTLSAVFDWVITIMPVRKSVLR